MLEATHHVTDKAFRVYVTDPGGRIFLQHCIADGLHQVSLTQPDAAVYKKWVIRRTGILGNLAGGCPCQLVAFALDEILEDEVRIEPADHRCFARRLRRADGRRRRRRRLSRTDFDDDLGSATGGVDQFFYPADVMFVQPIHDETIGCQQFQYGAVFNGLQRANPGIELLLGQLCLEVAHAAVPYCHFRLQRGSPALWQRLFVFIRDRAVYTGNVAFATRENRPPTRLPALNSTE